MSRIRTFVDSGVLIAAARGNHALFARAMSVLDDPNRSFVTSEFVRLEVVPKATYHKKTAELQLYEEFFASAESTVQASQQLVQAAEIEASAKGLAALDALHVTAAQQAGAHELVTSEKPTMPIFRTQLLPVKSLYPPREGPA